MSLQQRINYDMFNKLFMSNQAPNHYSRHMSLNTILMKEREKNKQNEDQDSSSSEELDIDFENSIDYNYYMGGSKDKR